MVWKIFGDGNVEDIKWIFPSRYSSKNMMFFFYLSLLYYILYSLLFINLYLLVASFNFIFQYKKDFSLVTSPFFFINCINLKDLILEFNDNICFFNFIPLSNINSLTLPSVSFFLIILFIHIHYIKPFNEYLFNPNNF